MEHIWNFATVGGVKRVNLENGSDLIHLNKLDKKLWTALSCPVEGLEIDKKTLELIDTDKNGQIRIGEILEAVDWIISILNNPNDLLKSEKKFFINENSKLGAELKATCKTILESLEKKNQEFLTVEDTSDFKKIFAGAKFNGDGVITTSSTNDEKIKLIINEIIDCIGSIPDKGEQPGVNTEILNKFKDSCENYYAWNLELESNISIIKPFGDNTEQNYQYFSKVKSKIDDYFLRCKISSFDSESTDTLNSVVNRIAEINENNLINYLENISTYNLSKVAPNKDLSLIENINPAWEEAIALFRINVFEKIFPSKSTLNFQDWQKIANQFEPYKNWIENKKGSEIEKLGASRIKEIIENDCLKEVFYLIEEDLKLETLANSIYQVDKLVRYYRDIYQLLKNFVTFYDFYSPENKAIFQAGTLYIDQRSCDLCIKVNDLAKHATMVSFSGMYLIYCTCISKNSEEKFTIVAALTNGDTDNLMVGRNALFYDRNGKSWDATIIKIVENPISIRQAFWAPYKKVSRMIENQINKYAATQDSKVVEMASKKIDDTTTKLDVAKKEDKQSQNFDIGKYVGIFAAIGLAVGAIGTMIASFITGFLGLVWWKMPIALLGLMLLISGPSIILAYLKLRKRNLAPILDANGWAINAKVLVNIPFGRTLTQLAVLPVNSKINLRDPFSKKHNPLISIIIILLIIASLTVFFLWKKNYIDFSGIVNWFNFFKN